MNKIRIFLFVFAFISIDAIAQNSIRTYEFKGGYWFDGRGFIQRTFYCYNGTLQDKKPAIIDSVIDLGNKYILPPFGEAHNHNIERKENIDRVIKDYLKDGVFYVKIQTNIWELSNQIQNAVNKPSSIDVIFANACLTGSGGHPVQLYKTLGKYGDYKDLIDKDGEEWFVNRAYMICDTREDFKKAWPEIVKKNPDFIKVVLSYSEDFEKNKNSTDPYVRKGLDPKLLPWIVRQCHSSGFKVSCHVETATDLHNALIANVDEITHLPGYYIHTANDTSRFVISSSDASLAAKRRVPVITTTVLSTTVLYDKSLLPLVKSFEAKNLKLLYEQKVMLAIGSDHSSTSLDEIFYLYDLHVFSNLELLKIACENTAKAISPGRKIGKLENGYEANFIVLENDPLIDLANIKNIVYRVKEGHIF